LLFGIELNERLLSASARLKPAIPLSAQFRTSPDRQDETPDGLCFESVITKMFAGTRTDVAGRSPHDTHENLDRPNRPRFRDRLGGYLVGD
jgi:hypothetical protein